MTCHLYKGSRMKQEYISIKKLAFKYDLHQDTIRKKPLIEGLHFVKIGRTIRYNIEEMHKLLTSQHEITSINLDKFLIDTIE